MIRRLVYLIAVVMGIGLAGCASKDVRRIPTPLTRIKPQLEVSQVWTAHVGDAGRYLFHPVAVGNAVIAAAKNGSVAKLDAANGQIIWRTRLPFSLSSGVGSDGHLTAVGGLNGQVFVLGPEGKRLWQTNVDGEIITPPLVGYGYVLVRTIDGQISAFNAQTGEQKWVYRNRVVPLNLRATMGMTFAGASAILAGFPGGVLAAIDLATGNPYWQTPVSFPAGVTEVERINDVAGAPSLVGHETCAATFQGRIACFEVESGQLIWERPFSNYGGIAANDAVVVAAGDRSVVTAYDAMSGQQLWQNEQLKNRGLGPPVIIGHAAVVGDYQGFLHFLSVDTGELIARASTDGNPIIAPPVLIGETLVVQTRKGRLIAFHPK